MGNVIDSKLRVHDLQGLRIVDASIFLSPLLPLLKRLYVPLQRRLLLNLSSRGMIGRFGVEDSKILVSMELLRSLCCSALPKLQNCSARAVSS